MKETMFSDELLRDIDELIALYPDPRSALIPMLHRIQRKEGWLSPESMEWAAEKLGLSPASVEGVTSFYSMFYRKPMGRRVIQVCRTLSCELRGASDILASLREKLGIDVGQTTEDGLWSLVTVECLGACGTAPAMMIDERLYENLSVDQLDEILKREGGSA
jgi:NADH-quinone oxidoreductase subunit E